MVKKLLAGTLLGAGLIACVSFIKKAKKLQADLEIVPKPSIYKASFDGIIIRLDLLLKNPTKGSFTMKFPFIKLSYKGVSIGSSQVVDKDIIIPAYGQVAIEKILIELPMQSIFSLSTSILKAITKKETITINAIVITTLTMGPVSKEYKESYELPIKP